MWKPRRVWRDGSCGTAAFRNERVIVSDIRSDPLWEEYRELAAGHGLVACWSQPIRSSEGEVLGTFAMYYEEPRAPTKEELGMTAITVQDSAGFASSRLGVALALEAMINIIGGCDAQVAYSSMWSRGCGLRRWQQCKRQFERTLR